MSITSYQDIIESIERLSIDEQDYLWELLRKRRVEKRRLEIAANARSTLESWKQGTAKVGTVEDLIADLCDDKNDEDSWKNVNDTVYRAWFPCDYGDAAQKLISLLEEDKENGTML